MPINTTGKRIVLPDPFAQQLKPIVVHQFQPDKRMAWLASCEAYKDGTATKKSLRFAKTLDKRKTKAEICAEAILESIGVKFDTQKTVGKYIADFYIPSKKLIIEIDGSVHDVLDVAGKDLIRDSFLKSLGYAIVRLTNSQVMGKRGLELLTEALTHSGRRLTRREMESLEKDESWGMPQWYLDSQSPAGIKARKAAKRLLASRTKPKAA